jgi:replicative DNA helicase
VLLLTGEPGDALVWAVHLKQPREPWGPVWVAHDHERGRSSVHKRVDPLELLAVTGVQTAVSLATAIFETEKPNRSQVERARRQLDKLVTAGRAYTAPGRIGGDGGSGATLYHPQTRNPTPLGEREQ